MKLQPFAAAALLLMSLPAFSQAGRTPDAERGPPVLTVSASADVAIEPDQAVVRLGVTAEAPDAGEAQNQVNTIMAAVIDAVAAVDIPERALRTEGLTLYPVYRDNRPRPNDEDTGPRISGYQASNVISIEVTDLGRIGEVVDAAIRAGANQLQGITFSARRDAGARADAMRLAVEEARLSADALADALGMRIAGVREVVAGGYDVRPPMPFRGEQLRTMDMASTPVQPGDVEISASVTVTYELAPAPSAR